MKTLKVKKLHSGARLPVRGSLEAAGYDLFAAEDVNIPSRQSRIVSTGIAIQLDPGYVMIVKERSGLATKTGLQLKAGVIDSDYRGDVGVVFYNAGEVPVIISKRDKIAQGIILKHETASVLEVEALDESKRGADGYGSTGDR